MGYPIWLTGSGDPIETRIHDLGRISGLDFFSLQLRAIDSAFTGTISYNVISGKLPIGLQLLGDKICGNAERVYRPGQKTNEDVTSQFTIRATNASDNSITDRTFKMTVTGNFPPEITTNNSLLGRFLDGTDVIVQLTATDTNNDPLTWSITSGQLPKGLTLDPTGLIYGVMNPIDKTVIHSSGWDNGTEWDTDLFELSSNSKSFDYNFTASVTDGKAVASKNFTIQVFLFEGLRSDSITLTIDDMLDKADISAVRQPILLTKSLGDSSTVNSGGYYAFQFTGVNAESIPLIFNLHSGTLPVGLILDTHTGWMSGYIPTQVETTKDYTFQIQIASSDDLSNVAPPREFTLTVIGNLNLAVVWETPADLGLINVGSISYLSVKAIAASGRDLHYKLKSNSKLPQGLKFLSDGNLSGRVSFQNFWMDSGTTTFDKELAGIFFYDNPTTFDCTCTFTVIASDFYNQISAEKTFSIRVNPLSYEPYENLYIRCLPDSNLRENFYAIVHNSDIFNPDDIFRANDPYFGLQLEVRLLVNYSIRASKLSDYINAMQTRHFNKVFYFGDYKLAQAKDEIGNIIYDVIYIDLIENTKIYETTNEVVTKKHPAAFTNLKKIIPTWNNPNSNQHTIAPNDLTLMQRDITNNLQIGYKNSLPPWMVSVQKNQRTIGFTTAAVLAYMKPNTGAKALFNLKKSNQFDMKLIPFVADRYVLDNSYSKNFNIETGQFNSRAYTNFDTVGTMFDTKSTVFDGRDLIDNYIIPFENDKYLKFPKIGVFTNDQ